MKRLHYFSGLTTALFVGLHLFNHLVSLWGPEAHINLMETLRLVYRNPIVETILLMAVVLQIVTGLRLFFSKRKTVSTFYEKLQIRSGLYLAFFLVMHVAAVLTGRYILNLDTNFYFGVAGLNTFPLYLFFVPYYGLAVLAFFAHLAAIHYQKMKREIFGISVAQQARFILALGALVSLIILYGSTNGFIGFEIPAAYVW